MKLFFLMVVLVLITLVVLWLIPVAEIIHNWKYLGKLPQGANVAQPVPLECLESGKTASLGCMGATIVNEYELPEKLLFS